MTKSAMRADNCRFSTRSCRSIKRPKPYLRGLPIGKPSRLTLRVESYNLSFNAEKKATIVRPGPYTRQVVRATSLHRMTLNCFAGDFDSGPRLSSYSLAIVTISVFGILPPGIALLRT